MTQFSPSWKTGPMWWYMIWQLLCHKLIGTIKLYYGNSAY